MNTAFALGSIYSNTNVKLESNSGYQRSENLTLAIAGLVELSQKSSINKATEAIKLKGKSDFDRS